jgi:hypothetical protein
MERAQLMNEIDPDGQNTEQAHEESTDTPV